MLCLVPDEPIDRDHFSKLLWPGRFEAQARASLRQCLLDLGKLLTAMDCDLLDISRSRISLNVEAVVNRPRQFLRLRSSSNNILRPAGQLLSIGAKPLLDQMHFGDDFENWLDSRRRQPNCDCKSAVSKALMALKRNDNVGGPRAIAQLLGQSGTPLLMPIDEADGRTSATFNDEPGHQMNQRAIGWSYPLENAGAKTKNMLADDVSRDLVAMLSRAPHLSVAAFDAGLRRKLEQSSPAEVGRSTKRPIICFRSLARRADRLVLRIGLVNVSTNAHILSWRLDEDIEQFHVRLDDFILDLSTPILGEIQIDEASTAHLRGDGKINGFEVVQSMEMLRALYSESRASRIVDHLRELIEREPANAVARGSLAVQLAQNVVNRWTETPAATKARGVQPDRKPALTMAPNDPDVLMAAGIVPAMQANPQSGDSLSNPVA